MSDIQEKKITNQEKSIEEKKQWILEMVDMYWDPEDKEINRDYILEKDIDVERVYKCFTTKDKWERQKLFVSYKEEDDEEYLNSRKRFYQLKEKADIMMNEFRAKIDEENDIREIEDVLSDM